MDTEAGAAGREAWALLGELMMDRRQAMIEAAAQEGLTPPHAFMLMRLREGDPPHLRELAQHMHCDPSYITSLADRLEERGLAVRRPSTADRRLKELVLTPAGLEAQARVRAAVTRPPEGLADLAEEDQRALLRIARHLVQAARSPG